MYIPKNKILPNLYTGGDEYQIISSQKPYKGYYHKLYNGKLFTGKTPNDGFIEEIELISLPEENKKENKISSQVAIFLYDSDPIINKSQYNGGDVINYTLLKGESIINVQRGNLPSPYYPQPTEADYKLGEFQRYFCVKANELKYTEVTKEQYEKFKNKDQSVAWQYYIAFTLPWDISGEKEQVYKTNRNIVLITEQNIKRRGLQEFLRKNYLKFYKEA